MGDKFVLCYVCQKPIHVSKLGAIQHVDGVECYIHDECLMSFINYANKQKEK